jgi:hypothetical protein
LVKSLRRLGESWATRLAAFAPMALLRLAGAPALAKPSEMWQILRLVAKFQPLLVLVSRKFLAEHPVAAWLPI